MTCTYVTRGHVPKDPGDELLDFVVGRLPEKPNERRDAAGRLDGALVLVVLTTVRQVSEKLRQARVRYWENIWTVRQVPYQ